MSNRVVTDFNIAGESMVIDGVRSYMYTAKYKWGDEEKDFVIWASDNEDALDQLGIIQRGQFDVYQVQVAVRQFPGSYAWGLLKFICRKMFYK